MFKSILWFSAELLTFFLKRLGIHLVEKQILKIEWNGTDLTKNQKKTRYYCFF